jgi:DNA-binding transcriptional ArsR family regulator
MVERNEAALDLVFHALADPSRRAILRRLSAGSLTVGELAEPLPMSPAAASKHIKVLEDCGLLRRDVRWRTHICTLDAEPLAAAQRWLDFYEQFWNDRFDALEELFQNRKKRREKKS